MWRIASSWPSRKAAASIDAIPASHSIGVEAREKLGGRLVLDCLVREGDQLPKKGKKVFKTEESLKARSAGSIKFKLWEGDIADPINDNRFIGMFEIKGSDIEDGAVIPAGAELICEYEVLDSGNITMEVSVPSIGGSFHSGRNFYSRQEGQIDYSQASKLVAEQSEHAMQRLEEMASKIDDPPPAGLRVLLQREANGGNRLAGLRDGDDGFGTCGNLEAARRFQLAVADLELNFLLLAASQQSDLGGHPRHSNGLPVVAHIELQFVGASNEFVLDLLGFCNSTTVHRL